MRNCIHYLAFVLCVAFFLSAGVGVTAAQEVQLTPSDACCRGGGSGWNRAANYENPSSNRLLYVRFPVGPPPSDVRVNNGEIWHCSASDGSGAARVCGDAYGSGHGSAEPCWIDDTRILYGYSRGPDPRGNLLRVRNIDGSIERDITCVTGRVVDYNEVIQRAVVVRRTKAAGARLWLLDPFHDRAEKIVDSHAFQGWSDQMSGSDDPNDWAGYHTYFSPSGKRLMWMIATTGKGGVHEHYFTFNTDGSDIRFGGRRKLMHTTMWDDDHLFGFDERRATPDHHGRLINRQGTGDVTVSGHGNHGAFSPDRKWIVAESWYGTDPVKLRLFRTGDTKPRAVLFSESLWAYSGPQAGHSFHVDPAFSHDGKSVYYNKCLGGKNGDGCAVFRYDLSAILAEGSE